MTFQKKPYIFKKVMTFQKKPYIFKKVMTFQKKPYIFKKVMTFQKKKSRTFSKSHDFSKKAVHSDHFNLIV